MTRRADEEADASRAAPLNRGKRQSAPSVAPLLEAAVQREVVAFYKMLGIKVYNLSQGYRPGGKRHGTTRQTKGLGDLYCIWPDRHISFWHETKRVGGKQTPEQHEFQRLNDLVGVTVVVGGLVAASDFVAHVRNVQTDPWPSARSPQQPAPPHLPPPPALATASDSTVGQLKHYGLPMPRTNHADPFGL